MSKKWATEPQEGPAWQQVHSRDTMSTPENMYPPDTVGLRQGVFDRRKAETNSQQNAPRARRYKLAETGTGGHAEMCSTVHTEEACDEAQS